jgi:CTP synthase (UTP-ammonia lyase)
MSHIALIGDYSASVPAHQAIPLALERVNRECQLNVSWRWVATRDLHHAASDLADFSGIWAVPASPYENTAGVLEAIRWARENRRPFLGTCGGLQHALIEFARDVLGMTQADNAETNPTGGQLIITRLPCSLVDQSGPVHLAPGSRIRQIYGKGFALEGYRCNYGPNPSFRSQFEAAGLHFTAFDESGEPRAAELPATVHPFFIGTLFQPERAALRGETPPVVCAFVQAAAAFIP